MLVPSKPCVGNRRLAASRIAARFSRSFGRPGIGFAGESDFNVLADAVIGRTVGSNTGRDSFVSLVYRTVYFLVQRPAPMHARVLLALIAATALATASGCSSE